MKRSSGLSSVHNVFVRVYQTESELPRGNHLEYYFFPFFFLLHVSPPPPPPPPPPLLSLSLSLSLKLFNIHYNHSAADSFNVSRSTVKQTYKWIPDLSKTNTPVLSIHVSQGTRPEKIEMKASEFWARPFNGCLLGLGPNSCHLFQRLRLAATLGSCTPPPHHPLPPSSLPLLSLGSHVCYPLSTERRKGNLGSADCSKLLTRRSGACQVSHCHGKKDTGSSVSKARKYI